MPAVATESCPEYDTLVKHFGSVGALDRAITYHHLAGRRPSNPGPWDWNKIDEIFYTPQQAMCVLLYDLLERGR